MKSQAQTFIYLDEIKFKVDKYSKKATISFLKNGEVLIDKISNFNLEYGDELSIKGIKVTMEIYANECY